MSADLTKQFLSSLAHELEGHRFRLTKDPFYGITFVRQVDDLRHVLDIDVANRHGTVVVGQLFVSVRFDSVERMVAKYEEHLQFVTDKDLAMRRTIGVHLGWSDDGFRQKKWDLRDEADVRKALQGVLHLFSSAGIPFLEKYSGEEEAVKVLAADDEEARRLTGPDEKRAKEAIAMALLTQGVPAALALREKKLAFLQRYPDRYAEVSKWADRFFAAEG